MSPMVGCAIGSAFALQSLAIVLLWLRLAPLLRGEELRQGYSDAWKAWHLDMIRRRLSDAWTPKDIPPPPDPPPDPV